MCEELGMDRKIKRRRMRKLRERQLEAVGKQQRSKRKRKWLKPPWWLRRREKIKKQREKDIVGIAR